MSASNVLAPSSLYNATEARLHSNKSWCSAINTADQYLQINLRRVAIITQVATQGSPSEDKFVTSYSLKFGTDGSDWMEYTEDGRMKVVAELKHCHHFYIKFAGDRSIIYLHVLISSWCQVEVFAMKCGFQ